MGTTRQRELVLDIVRSSSDHPTAQQVYERARARMPKIGLGTVYRNLNRLELDGRIRRIPMADASDRFDKTLVPHEHMTCIGCNRFFDFSTEPLALEALQSQSEYEIVDYHLTISCMCPECRAKRDDEGEDV